MERPHVLCHMYTSIDGKVTGKWIMEDIDGESENFHPYFDLHKQYVKEGYKVLGLGKNTIKEEWVKDQSLDLKKYESKINEINYEDNISSINKEDIFLLCFDRKGTLCYTSNVTKDTETDGYDGYKFVEVTTELAKKEYLLYLRDLGIPYMICGKKDVDVAMAMKKLKSIGIDKFLLEGGPTINGDFIKNNCIDEISMVMAPLTANAEDKSIFCDSYLRKFNLKTIERMGKNVAHLVYELK